MKKQIVLFIVTILSVFTNLTAQNYDGFKRKTPEEKLVVIHQKIDSAFKLDATKMAKVDTVFLNAFKEQDIKMDELRASGGMQDRTAIAEVRKKLIADRDEKLKAILTTEQMKIWKDEIEINTRPQRMNKP